MYHRIAGLLFILSSFALSQGVLTQEAVIQGAVTPVAVEYTLRGTIGIRWVNMTLYSLGEHLWGVYYADEEDTAYLLEGSLEPDGLFMRESADGTALSGHLIGSFFRDSLRGTWISTNGRRVLPMSLRGESQTVIAQPRLAGSWQFVEEVGEFGTAPYSFYLTLNLDNPGATDAGGAALESLPNGRVCSVTRGRLQVDCTDEPNAYVRLLDPWTAEVNFTSAHSGTPGRAIARYVAPDRLVWHQLARPEGESFAPVRALLIRP